jgi:anthranilate phosphoribosyltransferase
MKAVNPVRRALGVRTVFNVLGPLTNPAGARAQIMGVYSAHLVPIVAEAMRQLGVRHAFVVHGTDANGKGLDELSISGPTQLAEIYGDAITFERITPEQVGLHTAPIETLHGGDARANAEILRAIFAGEPGPRREVVLFNAAAVLITAGLIPASIPFRHEAFRAGIALAAGAIDSGAVTALVDDLAAGG